MKHEERKRLRKQTDKEKSKSFSFDEMPFQNHNTEILLIKGSEIKILHYAATIN